MIHSFQTFWECSSKSILRTRWTTTAATCLPGLLLWCPLRNVFRHLEEQSLWEVRTTLDTGNPLIFWIMSSYTWSCGIKLDCVCVHRWRNLMWWSLCLLTASTSLEMVVISWTLALSSSLCLSTTSFSFSITSRSCRWTRSAHTQRNGDVNNMH